MCAIALGEIHGANMADGAAHLCNAARGAMHRSGDRRRHAVGQVTDRHPSQQAAPPQRSEALNVSQTWIWPASKPRLNQRTRWAEEPCVKASGTT